jgi:hypothetical protein
MASRFVLRAVCLLGPVLLAGCHAGGVGNLAAKPEPSLPKVSLTAAEAIQKHNVNASRIQALDAKPKITVSGPINGTVDGRMAMERPKNFKLQMFTPMSRNTAADIGSNADEFWFWTKGGRGSKDNAILVCSYEDLDRSALSAAFQPDWIIEAMGLRSISREEAAAMSSKPGDLYGTIKLTSTRRGAAGETLTKETIIDPSGQIREHRLFQGEGTKKSLIAQAVITENRTIKMEGGESVVLPYHFKLEWMQERLALEILLDSPRLNPTWNDEERQARFSEPEIPGSRRVNLADYAPTKPAASRASAADVTPPSTTPRSRSSRSAPPPGGNIRLGAPEPFGVEGASRERGRDRDRDEPVALTADARDNPKASMLDQVVRPDVSRPTEQ